MVEPVRWTGASREDGARGGPMWFICEWSTPRWSDVDEGAGDGEGF